MESGVPPFRWENGLWRKYDPRILEIGYFKRRPEKVCPILREIFYVHYVLHGWSGEGALA